MKPPSRLFLLLAAVGLAPLAASAQPAPAAGPVKKDATTETAQAQDASVLPPVIVSEPKLAGDLLKLPLSVTATTGDVIEENAIRTVKEAATYSPNTFFTEFSARKLSNARIRGIGASPANPGVTTYLDGVPQINSNTSSLELLDVEQIDFVRGPAGALFGRNTVGGMINITSRRPALDTWGGQFETTFGNYDLYDFRGRLSGPLIQDQLGFSFAGGYNERSGYTTDTTSGGDIDSRGAWFGKTQFLWTPDEALEVRLILAGESSRDGDYALSDLRGLRVNPRRSGRSFLGSVERDVFMPTLSITYHADSFDFTSLTGYVWWRTEDITDLDYTAAPFMNRTNEEEQHSFTQEFRFSSPVGKPVDLGGGATFAWQAGLFYFWSGYEQQASTFLALPAFRNTLADQDTWGLGAYAQGTVSFNERLDLTAGLRWDYEQKDSDVFVRNDLAGPFIGRTVGDANFSSVTPQAAISWHVTPDVTAYFSLAGGYKAGGFNAVTLPTSPTAFDEERSWNYELGVKGRALDNKLNYSAAVFYTDWQNLQLNVAASPADYFIVNSGDATSKGVELAASYRPVQGLDLFASAGWQDARFRAGSRDGGANVSGNRLPYTPDYTVTTGAQIVYPVGRGYDLYARGDVQLIGSFNYDSVNGAAQDAYTLANFRLGVRNASWFVEGFVNNAFNSEYVPIAIPFPGLAPSGYVGENGAPATFGVRVGVKF